MRFALVILLLSSFVSAKAQVSFPDSSAQWISNCGGMGSSIFDWVWYEDQRYFLNGDSSLNGYEYSKVYYEQESSGVVPDSVNAQLIGLLRKDSSRVYYLGNLLGFYSGIPFDSVVGEVLLYDFAALPEDTIINLINYRTDTAYPGFDTIYTIVESVDTAELNGIETRRYFATSKSTPGQFSSNPTTISSDWNYELFGGAGHGLFHPLVYIFEAGCSLRCFESDLLQYSPSIWYNCSNVGVNEMDAAPEPCLRLARSQLFVECETSSEAIMNVFDLTGSLVRSTAVTGHTISLTELPAGIYVIQVLDADWSASEKLFIAE